MRKGKARQVTSARAQVKNLRPKLGPAFFTIRGTQGSLWPLHRGILSCISCCILCHCNRAMLFLSLSDELTISSSWSWEELLGIEASCWVSFEGSLDLSSSRLLRFSGLLLQFGLFWKNDVKESWDDWPFLVFFLKSAPAFWKEVCCTLRENCSDCSSSRLHSLSDLFKQLLQPLVVCSAEDEFDASQTSACSDTCLFVNKDTA